MRASINDGSVYDDNFTLLQKIRELSRRVAALENGGGGGGGSYELPTASATVKGGVKIGSGLQMTGEVLSATGGGGGSWYTTRADSSRPHTLAKSSSNAKKFWAAPRFWGGSLLRII